MPIKIPVEISARHIHLSQKDLEKLFGKNYVLKKQRDLTLPGEFAAEEKVKITAKKGELDLRVVGPVRKNTQIEISLTDSFYLGIRPVLKVSGDVKSTPGAVLTGPYGKVNLKQGVILAQRHIHCNKKEAGELGLKNGQNVSVRMAGPRGLVFDQVKIRVRDDFVLVMHLDTDEGNAAGINQKTLGFLV